MLVVTHSSLFLLEISELLQKKGIPPLNKLFSLKEFKKDPLPFYKYALDLLPSNLTPTLSHYFIGMLESKGKLLRNYTQNIDGLEKKAGVTKTVQCHGTFETSSCLRCGFTVPTSSLREYYERGV